MESEETRDETHVEQHGDGDVNVGQPAETPAEEPAQDGEAEQGEGGSEEQSAA